MKMLLCVFGLQASRVAGPCFMVRLNVLPLASLLADDTVLQAVHQLAGQMCRILTSPVSCEMLFKKQRSS